MCISVRHKGATPGRALQRFLKQIHSAPPDSPIVVGSRSSAMCHTERTYYPFRSSLSDCKCCAANRSQLVDFVVAQRTLIHHTHTHTKRTEESRPHVLPTLCQCRESVDADCGIKGEFHPQDPFFPLRDTINLRCSVHSGTYFVIKCCNLLIRCPRSLSTPHHPSAPPPNASPHFPE